MVRVIHFSLGIPPYRSGGLTKYMFDLALKEKEKGVEVSLLYPGGLNIQYPSKKIKKVSVFKGIALYEIKNPVNVPLLYGVRNPMSICGIKDPLSTREMEKFYEVTKPDIFHVHTLMSLPVELILFLKNKGVKILYTSHDYYGLCLRVNFINYKDEICYNPSPEKCMLCNQTAPSTIFLRVRNLKLFLTLKNKVNIKGLLKEHTLKYPIEKFKLNKVEDYSILLNRYSFVLEQIDHFHFNSSISQQIYSKYIDINQYDIIPVSNSQIKDNRKEKIFDINHIKLGFIGSVAAYKGLSVLKKELKNLKRENINNWSLQVWGNLLQDNSCENIIYKGKFHSSDLEFIFQHIDLLIVPSIWFETFSLVALEALSFGVPVLVSSHVGAKDIVKLYHSNFIYGDNLELSTILRKIVKDVNILKEYNDKIRALPWIYSFNEHTEKILDLYSKLLN